MTSFLTPSETGSAGAQLGLSRALRAWLRGLGQENKFSALTPEEVRVV
jgi:hypothetical protein